MYCGCTFLWRKIWANPQFFEPGKSFSRLGAWLYLTNALATGMDDEEARPPDGTIDATGEGCGPLTALLKRAPA